jgi:hypothetical protein
MCRDTGASKLTVSWKSLELRDRYTVVCRCIDSLYFCICYNFLPKNFKLCEQIYNPRFMRKLIRKSLPRVIDGACINSRGFSPQMRSGQPRIPHPVSDGHIQCLLISASQEAANVLLSTMPRGNGPRLTEGHSWGLRCPELLKCSGTNSWQLSAGHRAEWEV